MLTNYQPFHFFLGMSGEQRLLPAPALQKAFNTVVNNSQCHMQPAEPCGFPRWVTFMGSAAAEALEEGSEHKESSRGAEGRHVTEPSTHSNTMPSLYMQKSNTAE